jgi:VWFA-related protein
LYLTVSGKHDSPAIPVQSELRVSIDNRPAEVTSLRSASGDKLLFVLLVDISGSDKTQAASIKAAAVQLFQGLLADGNQGHLVLFNTEIEMSRKPASLSEVQSKLDRIEFHGGTALYDAIGDTCVRILSRSGNPDAPRRAIILLSDGDDDASHINRMTVEEIAEEQGVAIFSLATSSLETASSARRGTEILMEASQSTGGRAIHAGKLEKGVQPLLAAIRQQWALGLVPSQTPDQKLHSLSIKSTQKDVQLSFPAHVLLQ